MQLSTVLRGAAFHGPELQFMPYATGLEVVCRSQSLDWRDIPRSQIEWMAEAFK